jgi:predicted NBD/HSP70 family sugar kinase
MRSASRTLIRDINRSLVLNLVRERGSLSRAEIARISGLSPSTVTAITAALLADGYLIEDATPGGGHDGEERAPSRVGRPGNPLRVDPRAGFVVGLKVAADAVTAVLTDLAAEPLVLETLLRPVDLPAAKAAGLMSDAVERATRKARIRRGALLGVGIGVPGIVHPERLYVERSPLVEWSDVDLAGLVEERTGLPVHIDNDVNTLTIAEQLFGAGRGLAHFLVVTVGRGIGMGVVVNGTLYRGGHGGAGEFGHVVVAPDGRDCWCGRRGCLETIASEPALVREVLNATGRLVQPDDLQAFATRDERVARILAHAGDQVGRAMANVTTVLDPQLVIVAGEGVRLGPAYLEAMERALQEAGKTAGMQPRLVMEAWGDEAWARGAATLVLRELFHPAHLRDEGQPPGALRRAGSEVIPARASRGGNR